MKATAELTRITEMPLLSQSGNVVRRVKVGLMRVCSGDFVGKRFEAEILSDDLAIGDTVEVNVWAKTEGTE